VTAKTTIDLRSILPPAAFIKVTRLLSHCHGTGVPTFADAWGM
jgi:hypothetical protein